MREAIQSQEELALSFILTIPVYLSFLFPSLSVLVFFLDLSHWLSSSLIRSKELRKRKQRGGGLYFMWRQSLGHYE